MIISDNRSYSKKPCFRDLAIGDVFEYLEAIYIKTGVTVSDPNATDLKSGQEDIIRLDAEIEPVNAVLVINDPEVENF